MQEAIRKIVGEAALQHGKVTLEVRRSSRTATSSR